MQPDEKATKEVLLSIYFSKKIKILISGARFFKIPSRINSHHSYSFSRKRRLDLLVRSSGAGKRYEKGPARERSSGAGTKAAAASRPVSACLTTLLCASSAQAVHSCPRFFLSFLRAG